MVVVIINLIYALQNILPSSFRSTSVEKITPTPFPISIIEPTPKVYPYTDIDLSADLHHLAFVWLGDVNIKNIVAASESTILKSPVSGKNFLYSERVKSDREPIGGQKVDRWIDDLYHPGSLVAAGWHRVGAFDVDGPTGSIKGMIRKIGEKKQVALFTTDFKAVYWDPYKVTCPCFNEYTIFLSEPFDPAKYLSADFDL